MSLVDAYADAHLDTSPLDADITQVTAALDEAVARWERILNLAVSIDTSKATSDLAAGISEWEQMLNRARLTATVDVDTDRATGDLLIAASEWESLLADGLTAKIDLDPTEATARLAVARDEWGVLAGSVPVVVEAETMSATEQVAAAIAEMELLGADSISIDIDADAEAAVAHVAAAAAEMRALLPHEFTIGVAVNVEDEKLVALAGTFAGLKPLLDLPVRFHIDNESVIAVTAQIEAIATAWRDAVNVSVTPLSPEGSNDSSPGLPGNPAQPRAPGSPGAIPPITPELDPNPVIRQSAVLRKTITEILKITVPADLTESEALASAEALAPLIEKALAVTADVDLNGDEAVIAAEALDALLNEAVRIVAPVDVDDRGAIAQTTALRAALSKLLRDLTIQTTIDGAEASAQAVLLRDALHRILPTIHIPTEVDGGDAVAQAFVLRETLNKIAGKLHVDVDVDAAGSAAKVGTLRAIANLGSSIGGIFGEATGIFDKLFESIGKLDFVPNLLTNIARGGGTASGVFEKFGTQIQGAVDGLLSMAGPAAAAGGKAIMQFMSFAVMLATVIPTIGVALAGVTAAVAALNAALGAALVAAGSLIGLAGGFVTVAGGIGVAAAAAGVLGIALNKDLVQQAKDGMTVLKDTVASATREAGQHILDNFLAPYVNSLSTIARSAARLTPLLVDPIAEAGLRFTGVINQILQSDVGASIASKLGDGAAKFIDLFGGYLVPYSDLIDRLLGQTSGIYDIVQTVLELGLQAEPLFVAIGELLSAIAKSLGEFGSTGIPIVTRITEAITRMLSSDLWKSFAEFGAYTLNAILDLVGQIADGMKSIGLTDVFDVIAGAVARLVDSGVFERVGSILGRLLDLGANLLGPLVGVIDSAVAAIDSFLTPLLPVIETFVRILADQLAATINDLIEEGTFEELGKALAEILALAALLLPGLAQLIQLLAGPLASAFSAVGYVVRTTGATLYSFAAGVTYIIADLLSLASDSIDALTSVARGLVDMLQSIPDALLNRFAPGVSGMIDAIDSGLTSVEQAGVTAGLAAEGLNMVGDELMNQAVAWQTAGSAADRANMAFEGSNVLLEEANQIVNDYSDVLGEGAETVVMFGAMHGYSAEQIRQAADAAAAAAMQFSNTTKLLNDMREWASKPIELKFDFDQTKLDLDSLVGYAETTVKTVQDTVSQPINTDPLTESLAGQVVGADGTTLNDATSKPREEIVPAHLETSVADAVQELYDNALRDVDNAQFLKELRFNGYGALADQLAEFDGPKLELAIRELGDSTSAAVEAANAKILDAQRVKDEGFNPLQDAIDTAKKGFLAKARQVQIVAELESAGLSNLASQFASIKPEDLEAAIRTYETLGGADSPAVKAMEDQLVALRDAGEKFAVEIDPIGKMFQAAQNTPGARQGLIGKAFSGEELDWLSTADGERFYNTVVKQAEDLAAMAGREGLPPALAALADRWKKVFTGTLGENDAPMTDTEAKVVAAHDYHKLLGAGGSVDPVTGEVVKGTAGVAEATDAGKAVATAFANAMTGADGSKIVEDAANGMVLGAAATAHAAAKSVGGTFTDIGFGISKFVATGITVGGVLYLTPAMLMMIGTLLQVVETTLSNDAELVSIGRLMTVSVADGVELGAATRLYPAVLVAIATMSDLLETGVRKIADAARPSAAAVVSALALGITLGVPDVAVSLITLAATIMNLLVEIERQAVEQARRMGEAIAKSLTEGLSVGSEAVGGGGKKGGGGIGGAVGKAGADASRSAAGSLDQTPGVTIGYAIVDGIIAGMAARLPNLVKAATAMATIVATVVRTTLAIRSPSQVTATIGEQIAEGLASGIEAQHGRVVAAAQTLAEGVSAAIDTARPSLTVGVSGVEVPPAIALRPSDATTADYVPPQGGGGGAFLPAPAAAPGTAPAAIGTPAAWIHADVLNINGVPGAEQGVEYTEGEMWRLGFGQSPRR